MTFADATIRLHPVQRNFRRSIQQLRQYTYDANGNVLTDDYRNIDTTLYGRAAYAYHLDKNGEDIDYLYSIDDQRVFKRILSTTGTEEDYYLTDAMGRTIALLHNTDTTSNWEYYISGAEREARIPAGSTSSRILDKEASFYLYDHLGNTRMVYMPDAYMSSGGNYTYTVHTINFVADYFPYGKTLRKYVSGDEERFQTTQHERDEETGLDYRGARYYDADIARFLSLDPLAAQYVSYSAYCYVAGNPIMLIDPTGKEYEEVNARKSATDHIFEAMYNEVKTEADQYELGTNYGGWTKNHLLLNQAFGDPAEFNSIIQDNWLENALTDNVEKIAAKQVFPSFKKLWSNYPPDNPDGSHAHPSRDSYHNQCAIRMGYCLMKSGVNFSSYTEPLTSDGYPRGSKSLANWIWKEFGTPKRMSLEDFLNNYSDKTGIVFEYAEKGYTDHIDLWNKGKTGSGFYTVEYKEIWFWEIK